MFPQVVQRLLARRDFLRMGVGTTAGVAGAAVLSRAGSAHPQHTGVGANVPMAPAVQESHHAGHGASMLVGAVDPQANGFDPMQLLVDWDYGRVSTLPNGQRLREYNIVAVDKEIEIAPGVRFPAWTYNGRVPGPTIRCTEGDHLRINFFNGGSHPHTMHFHGVHTAEMDGVTGVGRGEILPGEHSSTNLTPNPSVVISITAMPHRSNAISTRVFTAPSSLTHCAGRPPAREFLMMMNAFDTNFDGKNEIYAVNTVGHEFARRPIPIQAGELVRLYLINITEFDPINSLHIHAEFFDYYDHGTTLEPTHRKIDTIMQCQAQRGLVEFRYRWPGTYMFHAHQSEFAELGWMGFFKAVAPDRLVSSAGRGRR